ncbi:MAG: NAD-glutamate dehydrogenase [Devosia sp.]|nr:NAD-glutamate dehydrogenase [Devosia sp.]
MIRGDLPMLNDAVECRTSLVTSSRKLQRSEPDFARYLGLALAATDSEDFAFATAPAIEAAFRGSYERLAARAGDAPFFAITPATDLPNAPLIIDVLAPDTPFIVDSILAAIRAGGGVPRFLAHPILPFDPRDPAGTASGTALSALHIAIDPLPAPAARALKGELAATLTDIGRAVAGWRPMLERLQQAIAELRQVESVAALPADITEAVQFLGWLAEHNFTFLGMRQYRIAGTGKATTLSPVRGSGLGILSDAALKFLRSGPDYVEMTPQHAAFLAEPAPLLVTKANIRARVHRRAHMDYIGVKLYAADGSVTGELRILGLFTSMSLASPNDEVPLLRKKLAAVMQRSGHAPQSHAGKALKAALDTYPRDELFQIDIDQLGEFAAIIAALSDRPRVRVLARTDRFDNFVSVLLYVPRERYDSDVRARVGDHLARRFDGRVSAFYPHFLEGDLVRAHFIIGRSNGPTPVVDRATLEAEVDELTQRFGDRLMALAPDTAAMVPWRDAFPADYRASVPPAAALADIAILAALDVAFPVAVRLVLPTDGASQPTLQVFHRETPLPLSDRVPLLENFGFRVIEEQSFTITPAGGAELHLHEMTLAATGAVAIDYAELAPRLEAALLAIWAGQSESDRYNQLTVSASLAWPEVAILRAYGRYLRQLNFGYSQAYLATVLNAQPEAATALVRLFETLFDPELTADRDSASAPSRQAIAAALDATTSLDEDRILRRFLNLVEASLRTNAFQRDADGKRRPALAIKLDCRAIEDMPDPKPYREIFVSSPRVEGLHLRFGAIARGGIRWSDRPEDFRTEVLGLVKAQQVKNAFIVPVGATGGFVPKHLPPPGPTARDAIAAEGVACYRVFIGALLDVTDNYVGSKLVPPTAVVRRDGDDPYLVVAADKGTATFSDIANEISLGRQFWLGDAFASGGSVGYDHKKMGITARGAFESVKRHFRELDRDILTEPFTVVGVGDMSGDVFGNGMLLSPEIRLIAAFDHRDILIDPTPDAAATLAERQRLFALPRSSWQDFSATLISKGGGVFSRALKSIPISPEIGAALGLAGPSATPSAVMTAILKANVDLLWFGGIGTYVRATSETDTQAGDKANDAIRITGSDIRAKVIGEGANLAMTQRSRIEYALSGGRLNTDAIDNSAGVNSSDLEVNIKIALGELVRAKKLTTADRNVYLPTLTDEVAALCLRNNYLQSLAISMAERRGMLDFPDHVELMNWLEARGDLQRAVEYLPDAKALDLREKSVTPLTRPELAVLLAYAKISLYTDLLASTAPDDPYLAKELFRYFPEALGQLYPKTITGHRLRREVIATVIANAMINRGGPAFVSEMVAATSADAGTVALAYTAVRDSYGLTEINTAIDALDGTVTGDAQLGLYAAVQALLVRETLWFLRNASFAGGLEPLVTRHRNGVAQLQKRLSGLLPPGMAADIAAETARYEAGRVPTELARRIAELPVLGFATDIVAVAERSTAGIAEAAAAFFGVIATFGLAPVIAEGGRIALSDRFDRMALDRALANLTRAQRDLATDILAAGTGKPEARLANWRASHGTAVDKVAAALADLTGSALTVSRLSVAAGLLADLAQGT